jgi:hypothetical protein
MPAVPCSSLETGKAFVSWLLYLAACTLVACFLVSFSWLAAALVV